IRGQRGLAEAGNNHESDNTETERRTRKGFQREKRERIMTFANQVAIITGASSGIGWSLAKELAKQGAKVGLLARRRDHLEQLREAIHASGGTVAAVPADVADREQTVAAIQQLRDQLGPVDLLVANAGVGAPTAIEPMNTPDLIKMYQVNVFGVIHSI